MLIILTRTRIHVLERIIFGQYDAACLGRQIHRENLEHQILLRIRRPILQARNQLFLLLGAQTLKLVNLVINATVILWLRDQFYEFIHDLGLLLHIVPLGNEVIV